MEKVEKINEALVSTGISNGFALTCQDNCEIFGRGHVHPVICEKNCQTLPSLYQHDDVYDYMSCKNYFEHYLHFEHPGMKEDFNKCGDKCGHHEHVKKGEIRFCIEECLHKPILGKIYQKNNKTYLVSQEGHAFDCIKDHSNVTKTRIQIIVLIDSSGSMNASDIKPQDSSFHQNRYGAAIECLHLGINKLIQKYSTGMYLTCVDFTEDTKVILENQECIFDIVKKKDLNSKFRGQCTDFNVALEKGMDLIEEYKNDFVLFIFLSDGEDSVSPQTFSRLEKVTHSVESSTIVVGIGKEDKVLKEIAQKAKEGKYQTVKGAFELKEFLLGEVFNSIGRGAYGFYVNKK